MTPNNSPSPLLGEHLFCFACGELNPLGLKLKFHQGSSEWVHATWNPSQYYEGYYKILNGGVIATLLESSMLHVLFALKVKAMTTNLALRYHHQVSTDGEIKISARLKKYSRGLYHLESSIAQNNQPCVSGTGKFSKTPES